MCPSPGSSPSLTYANHLFCRWADGVVRPARQRNDCGRSESHPRTTSSPLFFPLTNLIIMIIIMHVLWQLYEQGSSATLGGIHSRTVPNAPNGTMALSAIEALIRKSPDDPHLPLTKLVCLENTHNRMFGTPISAEYTGLICFAFVCLQEMQISHTLHGAVCRFGRCFVQKIRPQTARRWVSHCLRSAFPSTPCSLIGDVLCCAVLCCAAARAFSMHSRRWGYRRSGWWQRPIRSVCV
jgi:hypothetical protein